MTSSAGPDKNELERTTPFPGPSGRQQLHQAYKFSQEEMRVMRECNRESFWRRCLPIGTAMGVAAYVGVNTGYLKRSPKYGATPKVVVSVIVGYFLGKFSYQTKCAEKLMQLPNSQIGEMLRKKRQGYFQESLDSGLGPGMSLAPFSTPAEQYSDVGPRNSLDIDTSRPDYDSLDDSLRPTIDSPIYEEEMPPVQKHTTTYDELRKKNREEYQQHRVGLYRNADQRHSSSSSTSSGVNPKGDDDQAKAPVRTNRYGDALV